MTMTISEALSALDCVADDIGGEYHYVAMRISEAVHVIRSRLEVTSPTVHKASDAYWDHMATVVGGVSDGDDKDAMKAALVAALGDGK